MSCKKGHLSNISLSRAGGGLRSQEADEGVRGGAVVGSDPGLRHRLTLNRFKTTPQGNSFLSMTSAVMDLHTFCFDGPDWGFLSQRIQKNSFVFTLQSRAPLLLTFLFLMEQ